MTNPRARSPRRAQGRDGWVPDGVRWSPSLDFSRQLGEQLAVIALGPSLRAAQAAAAAPFADVQNAFTRQLAGPVLQWQRELGAAAVAQALEPLRAHQQRQAEALVEALRPSLPSFQLGELLGGAFRPAFRLPLLDVLSRVSADRFGLDEEVLALARDVVEGLDEDAGRRVEAEAADVELDEQAMRPLVEALAAEYAADQRSVQRAAVVAWVFFMVMLTTLWQVAEHYDEAQVVTTVVGGNCLALALAASRMAGRAFDAAHPPAASEDEEQP